MRAPVVVELDPVGNRPAGMLQAFEAVPVHALLLQGPDHALHHAVLLRAVRGDELLAQALAADQWRVGPAYEDQAVVRAQQERTRHRGKTAKACDQRLLRCRGRRRRPAAAR